MGRAFEFRKARKMKRWSKMSKIFTRIGKDIIIAVKDGGPDPDTNSRLRQVMQNAKTANMPKENVLRAIKKASSKDVVNYDGELIFDTTKPDGMPRKVVDVGKLESIGWTSKINLRDGMASTYDAYLNI